MAARTGGDLIHLEGFGERGGFGGRPALVVIDMTLGFTDPDSPLACDLERPVANIQRLLEAARRARIPVAFTTVAYRESDKLTAAAFIDKIPLSSPSRPGAAGRRSTLV